MLESKLNWRQRVALECLWFVVRCFAALPYWFKYYLVEPVIFFVLYYCVRYRRKVVMQNLRNSFPEKSDQELSLIRRRFYVNLSEVFIDILNMSRMTNPKVRAAMSIQNLEGHIEEVHGHDWIAMMAHYGCWEYCFYWGVFDHSQMTVGVYHPLSSEVMECFFRRLRKYDQARSVTMKESLRFYLRNSEHGIDGRNIVLGLVADQNPPKRPDSHWFRFLNQDTIFFDGAEKLAQRCKLPVYFVDMTRIKRGCYKVLFERIYDGVEQVSEHEITERYVRCLEAMIRKQPELWMWSHRRWKHKRSNVSS